MYSVRVLTSGAYSVEAKVDYGPLAEGIMTTAQTVTVQAWTGMPDRVELKATMPAYPATVNCGDMVTATVAYALSSMERAAVFVDGEADPMKMGAREPRGYVILNGPASGTTSILFTCNEACVDTGIYAVIWDMESREVVASSHVPAMFTWQGTDRSSTRACIANMRNIDGATQQFMIEQTGQVTMVKLVPTYLKRVPTCPVDGKAYIYSGTNDPCVVCPNYDKTSHPAKL